MYGEFLKWHISQLVAPIEALFVASPPAFGGLHNDIKFFVVRRSYRKLLKKKQLHSQRVPTIVYDYSTVQLNSNLTLVSDYLRLFSFILSH